MDYSAGIRQVLAVTKWHSLLVILAETGMRPCEVAWLAWDNVDLERGTVTVRGKPGCGPKFCAARVITLTPTAREVFAQMPCRGRYVFTAMAGVAAPSGGNAKRLSLARVLSDLRPLLKNMGLPVNLHFFRAARVQQLVDRERRNGQ
jgi:integrase